MRFLDMGRDEFVARATRHLVPSDDADAHAAMTLDGVYDGESERIRRLVRIAYRRGVRRGAASAWSALQPIRTRAAMDELAEK